MKSPLLVILMLVSSSIVMKAQPFSHEFGKVGKESIQLENYGPDKSAAAVVLFDIGKSKFIRVREHYELQYERMTRIKILDEAGTKWAEVQIPFYQEGGIYEKVFDIEGYTYNFDDGRLTKTPLDLSNVFEEKVNEFWNVKKFALPKVKKGSVIEFRYTLTSQYLFNLRDWEFQWNIPVDFSSYQVRMIPFYEYTWLLQGATKFDYQNSYVDRGVQRRFHEITFQDMVSKYEMTKLPAFQEEEYMTCRDDYLIKIDFQLSRVIHPDGSKVDIMTTWPDLIKEMGKTEQFGKYAKKAQGMAGKVYDMDKLAKKTERSRFDSILNVLKQNYTWNGTRSIYTTMKPNEFVKNKTGNSAEMNLFAAGCLNAAGIEAYPVLISTRDHGRIKYDYPYINFFNNVIVAAKIDGEFLLADITDPYLKNGRIPSECINDKGLIIDKNQTKWIELHNKIPAEKTTSLDIELADGLISAKIRKESRDYYARDNRADYGEDIEKIKERFTKKGYSLDDSTIEVKNLTDLNEPYIVSCSVSQNQEGIENKIYVSPFLAEPPSYNPFKHKIRNYPVDFGYPVRQSFSSEIEVPDGYVVDYIPEEYSFSNELFEINYKVMNEDGKHLQLTFEYYFKYPVYYPKEYQRVKYYYNEIVKRGNDKVVLKKI